MELWKWELRKIWRPGILAAILLLGAVYYWMFPQFYIEYFCNGPNAEAQFDLASDWVARYGPTLEPEERAQLDGQLAEEIDAFAQQIAAIPEASAAGLTDYESFLSLYYRVVVIKAPLQGLCYTVRDAVDWCFSPTTRMVSERFQPQPLTLLLIS